MKIATIFVFASLLLIGNTFADIPHTLNYQGRLMDQSGQPVLDGQYTVTFRLYTAASGGNMVWEEQQTVATQNGYFNTVLGNTTALTPSMFSQPLWAGMQIGSNPEMTPRQKLSTAAYAMTVADGAITTNKILDGAVTSDKLNGDIKTGQILDDAITSEKIKDGEVQENDIADGAITADKIATGAVLPIGTILPWHKSFNGTPALPVQFVECNGQTLNDLESPYHDQIITDLNGQGRFLRGSSVSGIMQADELRSHAHQYVRLFYIATGGQAEGYPPNDAKGKWADTNTTSHGGSETRPINMSVVWIMKIK